MKNIKDKKRNIGIIFSAKKGGIFQYSLSIAEALINYCDDFNYTIVYFDKYLPQDSLKIKNIKNVKFVCLIEKKKNLINKIGVLISILVGNPLFMVNKYNKKLLRNAKIDLLILPSPQLAGFEDTMSYILPIPDMMYKHYYTDFPEYSSLKSRIISDVFFRHMARHSNLCVADSQWGKNDIVEFFGQRENKIKVIPFIPPGYIYYYKGMSLAETEDTLKKYNIPEKFIFYPAQFWPHKNHLRLIEAINILKERYNTKINIVLVGNPKANADNYDKMKKLIRKSKIEDQVFILGYVSDKEIVALYKKCLALVFPTFAGPTNIPIIEAMVLGVPVLCSNLFAMPEQVGDAGILFDPLKPDDIAEKIYKVRQDENLRNQMIEKGYKRMKEFNFENYSKMWIAAVKETLSNLNKL